MHIRRSGFTLIELMVVVAMMAILASIAYPSYDEALRRSRRATAQAQMLEAAHFMQRFYSQNDAFDQAIGSRSRLQLPGHLQQTPSSGNAHYRIALVEADLDADAFTLKAEPVGAMHGDRCGSLLLSHTGRRQLGNARTGLTLADCWR